MAARKSHEDYVRYKVQLAFDDAYHEKLVRELSILVQILLISAIGDVEWHTGITLGGNVGVCQPTNRRRSS